MPEIHRAEYLKPRTGSQKLRCVITYLQEQGSQDPSRDPIQHIWVVPENYIFTSTLRIFLCSGKFEERWTGPTILSNISFTLRYCYL